MNWTDFCHSHRLRYTRCFIHIDRDFDDGRFASLAAGHTTHSLFMHAFYTEDESVARALLCATVIMMGRNRAFWLCMYVCIARICEHHPTGSTHNFALPKLTAGKNIASLHCIALHISHMLHNLMHLNINHFLHAPQNVICVACTQQQQQQ